jgi:hypothetical protein
MPIRVKYGDRVSGRGGSGSERLFRHSLVSRSGWEPLKSIVGTTERQERKKKMEEQAELNIIGRSSYPDISA